MYLYGKNFKADEVKARSYNHLSSSLFSISTLNRLQEIFPVEGLVKVNSHRDTTVICPFGYIDADMSIKFPNNKYGTFEAGKLFIPIKADGDNILAFFLCGLDENDEIPDWVVDNNPCNLELKMAPSLFNTTPDDGLITCKKDNLDWANILRDQVIEDGSVIKVRSEYYEFLCWSVDCFKPQHKCIRFTRNFTRNANNAKYFVCEPPLFKGNFQWINKSCTVEYRPFTIQLDKINEQDYGRQIFMFQNACFNRMGFLIHDTAV